MKLSEMLAGTVPPLSPAPFIGSRKLEKAIERALKICADVEPTPGKAGAEALLRALMRRMAAGDWDGYTYDDLGVALRAAFAGARREGDGTILLRDMREFSPARDFLIEQAARGTHGGLLGAVLATHLATYAQGAAHTIALAEALKARRRHLPTRSRSVLKALPEALDGRAGADRLGRRIAESSDTAAFLADLPVVPSGGLIDAAGEGFVAHLAPKLADPAIGRRVLDWFAPKGEAGRGVGAPQAIDALLAPWDRAEPPEAWKRTLLDRLVDAYGDPRLAPGGAWGAVAGARRETFIRWQTGAALDAFLDIVSETIEPKDRHMWADRRPFWESLYEQGYIRAAWVAFSASAARVARKRADTSGIDALRHFGRQIAGGGRVNTSILVMNVNGKIVVEGSHSYKVHVFPADHPDPPDLFQPRYDCEAIRLSLGEMHKKVHDRGGNWQSWVKERIGCPL